MNVAETIQAAIEKLQHLRDNSTPGPWLEEDHEEEFVGFIVGAGYKLATEITIIEDGQLIVTLHRTMDAQLAILRASQRDPAMTGHGLAALSLARAILGEVS